MKNLKKALKLAMEKRENSYNAKEAEKVIKYCSKENLQIVNFNQFYEMSIDDAISRTLFELGLNLADYHTPMKIMLTQGWNEIDNWIEREI